MANQPPSDDTESSLPDETHRAEVGSDYSPSKGEVPFWLHACVRLLKPGPRAKANPAVSDKVLSVATFLEASQRRVFGEAAVEIDRDVIALVAGYEEGRAARWIIDFLKQAGFLVVRTCHAEGTGRRLPDQFAVSVETPPNYLGPRTAATMVRALRENETWTWSDLFSQVNTGASPDAGGFKPGASPDAGGSSSQVNTGASPDAGGFKPLKEGSFASFPRKEGSEACASIPKRDAASLRTAGDVARTEHPVVWEMAGGAPWAAKGHDIQDCELAELVPAIVEAMHRRELTLDQVRQHLDVAVAKLTGKAPQTRIRFVVRAFTEHAPAAQRSDQRPLPSAGATACEAATATSAGSGDVAVWCGNCAPPVRTEHGKTCAPHCTSTAAMPAEIVADGANITIEGEGADAGGASPHEGSHGPTDESDGEAVPPTRSAAVAAFCEQQEQKRLDRLRGRLQQRHSA